ncbi:unnamed protein product, partial [Rotaria magnacalcarata]
MNESILNHLFLPHYLPSSVDDDYFLQNNHQYEHMILEYMKEYFNQLESTKETSELPIFSALINCVKHWSILQNPQTCTEANLQSTIMKLTPGNFLPFYFHAQNAAILIEIEKKNVHRPLVSSWQVLLPTQEITSSLVPHFSCFPVTTYRLNDRSQLSSLAHCELLVDFMRNTIEYSKSYKASRQVNETPRVKPTQFVEFGSFRSGHRLQWWNLLAMLELDSLPIAEESVAILIIHSILQYGPLAMDGKPSNNSWCSEAHKQLLEDNFIDELTTRLDRRLDDCELNWQNELVLLVITMITMRMLTICNSTREGKVVNLAIKCRRIGEKWIDLISETIKFTSSPDFSEVE